MRATHSIAAAIAVIAALATGACSNSDPAATGDAGQVAANSAAQPGAAAAAGAPGAPSAGPGAGPGGAPGVGPSGEPGVGPSAGPGTAAAATGPCGRKASTKPVTRITEVKLGARVTGYGGEGDTDPLPMAIAARPDGGSWLAWRGIDGKVYLGKLGCDDKLVGKPTSFAGIDLQDVQADANGGVLLLTRKGTCGTGPLCGGESSPCNTMHMIRFDNAGKQVWQRQVTNLTGGRQGYDDGARFVWWYQHHGRLATDGNNWAAYFGTAITVKNGNCVDIHQGDRIQVVNAKGGLVSGHKDAAEVGCSHAWTSRIVWDPRTKRFVAVCATDNNCRIARPNPYRTVAAGKCDGTLFGGDLVLAKSKGYWTAWSQGGSVRLEHFTTGKSDTTIRTGVSSAHPHLVSYGAGRMLLAWQSGSTMAARVYDSGTGKAIGAQFTIKVKDHSYQAFKAYPDGSAAYPAAGSGNTSIRIARVLPVS